MVLSGKDSRMIISGTSSLHPWQCKVEQMSGQLHGEISNGSLKNITSFVFSAGVFIRSIKENGEYYDKNMDKKYLQSP